MKAALEIEVTDIRKMSGGDGKLRALADVQFGEGLIVKGFSVVNGKNGIFVSGPRKATKDGRWFDILDLDDQLKRDVEDKVLEAYDREAGER